MTESTSIRVDDILDAHPGEVAMMIATKLGWRVLPLDGKRPILNRWQYDATTDSEIVEYWWSYRFAGASCGIATGPESGIWVLDLDVKNGIDGSDSLAELAAGRELPETFTVRSSSGRGLHLYWAWPELDDEERLANSNGRLGPGIDVKGDRGQVRAPHKAADILDDRWPVPAPDWLVGAAVNAAKRSGGDDITPVGWSGTSSAIQDAVMSIARADSGTRNDTLNKMAFLLGRWSVELGITEHQAWIACEAGCRTNGLWAEEPEQCRTTFMSGWNAGVNNSTDR